MSSKNRVAFPSKFKKEMGGRLIITKGYEGCIVVVDEGRWNNIVKDVVGGNFVDRRIRSAGRFLLASAREVECDEQGRFVIPSELAKHAELEEDVVFVGLVNWVELWPKKKWDNNQEYLLEKSEDVAQEIADLMQKKTDER